MEYGQVKINYISKKNATDAISAGLGDLFLLDDLDEYKILDNLKKGIRLYPEGIKEQVERCTTSNLILKIKEVLDKGTRAIIINEHEIDYDVIKNKIMPLAQKYKAAICINILIDEDIEDRLTITFNSSILKTTQEEWEETKINIKNSLKSSYEKEMKCKKEIEELYGDLLDFPEHEDYDEDDLSIEERKELYKLFKLEPLILENDNDMSYNRFQFDEIKESYSYKLGDDVLSISLTAENDIIISDEDESVKIKNSQFKYLINTLKNLINI